MIIQSHFSLLGGQAPSPEEIVEFAQRLCELKAAGAQILLVQIYSATRPKANVECDHLPLKTLSQIAKTVRTISGLRAEVFEISTVSNIAHTAQHIL